MNRFARQAYSSVLKDHIAPGTPAPEELLNFRLNTKKSNGTKRQHVPTKRLEESKQQEETLSPKKRKKEARQQVDKQQKTVSPKKKEAKKSTPKEKNPTQASVCQDSMLEMCKNMTGLFQQFKGQTQSALTVTPLKDKTQLADQIQSAEIPKAKTPSADQIQSEEIPKTKTQSADQIQSEEIPKTKTQSADQIQSEEIPKTKTQSADQIQSEEIPKTKTQLADQIQSEVKPKDKTQSEENQKVQTRPSENCTGTITTPLTDTWGACHRALSFVDEVSTEQMPVASANVLSTIRGLLNPEFLDFMRRLSDHMESSTCPHTCMKVMMEKNVSANPDQMNHTVQQGFLAQLADLNSIEVSKFSNIAVHVFPVRPSYSCHDV
ncbi:uncharacterized protein LOC128550220 [Mercenaria mercenaria]|uniref:uncharacterized protein LOC128550220 n=1 Tax=Mercenaria mercenaria TaxID=6596 RepID=UPI00234F1FAF|nr:uncharacterized protein LOC128550220 [Mercenaria mercenaria]